MARSEYSHLRGIAQRRIDRLISQGFAPQGTRFPTVAELGGNKNAISRALRDINIFLSSGSTLKEVRQTGKRVETFSGRPQVLTEKQIKEQIRRERISRTLKARAASIRELSEKQKGFLKGAASIGLHLKIDEINEFAEYVEYRFAQNKDASWYTIVDDYETLREKKKTGRGALMQDFARYKTDRENLANEANNNSGGMSSQDIDRLWSDFVKS